uniref:Serpin domain-containing protein n=1 Tax=Podarcis muralis TaxID=64176 RepID=A0A670IAN4_PODMU
MAFSSEANAKLYLDLFRLLRNYHRNENILLSPLNFSAALHLLYGARGNSAGRIEMGRQHWDRWTILTQNKASSYIPTVHTAFHRILAELNKPSTSYELSFANRLYGDQSIAFLQKFLYCALKLYLTEVDGADIHNAPEEVRRLINLWAEVQTHGKIQDLLPKDSFDCLAQLLHVNALYFKGQWDVKFDKELTRVDRFYLTEGCDVQMLEIPYRNNELSLFILLPRDCDPESLHQLEDGLSYDQLLNWSCILKPEEVEVVIPKFSLEKSVEVNAYLDLSPLTDPEKADLSGATITEGVALTQLVHDTFIEIDEEGGEEAEAPACPKDRRPRQEPKAFLANHPFLYFVLHKCTQSLIAFGKFARPE